MKIEIEIPEEFEEHFYKDKFSESFGRIIADIESDAERTLLAGNYEKEVVEMLKKAFEAVYVPECCDECCGNCVFFSSGYCFATSERVEEEKKVKITDHCHYWRKLPQENECGKTLGYTKR